MQNALLKPLEDTPNHVYFFLCTTDPAKIIKAIKSRCTEIKTSPLSEEELLKLVSKVNKAESLNINKNILSSISEKAQGSPRKALVLLESASNVESDEDKEKLLSKYIPDDDDVEIIELCRVLMNTKSEWNDIAGVLRKLKEGGKLENDNAETIRYIVMGYASAVLLKSMNKRAAIMLEAFSENTFNSGKNGIILACLNVIS
jgi:DNA polymerase III gamma/tau subunit